MSFRLKTILGIAIIELTVMAILIGVNQFALGGSATTQLYERAQATGRIFANMVSDAVISTDLATLDAMIATAVSTEDLTYLRIRGAEGLLLSQGGLAEALDVPFVADDSYESALSDHRIDIQVPIDVQGTTFGFIEIGLSTSSVEEEIASALRWNLLVAGIGMSLVAVFGYGLGSILTRQLSGLRKGARAITSGDLGHQVPVRGRDELADTALCFNTMAQTLAEDRAVLQTQRSELLAKKERVEVIVDCMTAISERKGPQIVPDTDRGDEIGNMARATVVFQNSMRAVEQARLEQQRLITAFDQIAEQVIVFGTDDMAIFLNSAFRRFNRPILNELDDRFSLAEFLATGCRIGAFPEANGNPQDWIDAELARDDQEPREILRDPDRVHLTVHTRVEGVGHVVTAKDVTDLRNSEKQLVQASKLATLGEMATGIAHELNQPLGVIRMASTNSIKRIEKGHVDPDYLSKKLVRIEEQTERASQIINHMRVFGRKADGKMEPFDLLDSLSEVASLARAQLQTLDIALTTNLPRKSGSVMGERVLFEQVLLNIISNARDAITSQGRADGIVTVAAETHTDGGHVIEVTDNGGGIPEAVLDKLFEPFFTTKEPGKGTGLGLSISFGTIRDMSGTISATNTNEGACFRIVLPCLEETNAEFDQDMSA
jgi:C4-dicarboxylate-specific signal transduction histidine kinase